MRRARARSMRLDRQASLGGCDHHVEKNWALPTGSGSSDVRTAAAEQTLISWVRLAVKERRRPPRGKGGPAQKATQG
eukprot:3176633-Prymnesium_polylepis.1